MELLTRNNFEGWMQYLGKAVAAASAYHHILDTVVGAHTLHEMCIRDSHRGYRLVFHRKNIVVLVHHNFGFSG